MANKAMLERVTDFFGAKALKVMAPGLWATLRDLGENDTWTRMCNPHDDYEPLSVSEAMGRIRAANKDMKLIIKKHGDVIDHLDAKMVEVKGHMKKMRKHKPRVQKKNGKPHHHKGLTLAVSNLD